MNQDYRLYTLVAELTYRCPLRCLYCSNPMALPHAGADGKAEAELSTEEWARVFADAEALGAMQLNLSGGEPLARPDLEALIRAGRQSGFYTNLITSAVGLTQARLARLRESGLDAVQISFQDVDAGAAEKMAGRDTHQAKLDAAAWARDMGLPLTVNVVMHRGNLERISAIIEMAHRLGADRVELANAQYLGWALANRALLLPGGAALEQAREAAAQARARLGGKLEVLFVLPDYHAGRPRACMEGWGSHYLIVNPYGQALPCQAAASLPDPVFENVRGRSLQDIWLRSHGFNAFRGEAWMSPTCRSCEHRATDFGGCRCQAFHLTGDAAATDPACSKSPHHHLIESARAAAAAVLPAEAAPIPVYRRFPAAAIAPSAASAPPAPKA